MAKKTYGLLVSALLIGTAFIGTTSNVAFAQPRVDDLEPSPPISCNGSDDVVIQGRLIEVLDTAVKASGNCSVTIIDSRIVAGDTAIRASGNADIRIEHSHVQGADKSMRASGNAEIRYMSTVTVGEVGTSGNAEIFEGGDNTVSSGTGAGRSGIDLGGIRIDESGVQVPGVVIDQNGVRAGGTQVTTDADGNVVIGTPGASVVVDGDYVRIGTGGSVVEVDGDWRTAVRTNYDTSRVLVELGAVEIESGWQLNLAGDVLFDFNSAAVRADAAEQLKKVAHVLRDRAAGEVRIIGHTDSVGEESYNQSLSEQRAVSVMQWLNRNESIPVNLMKGQGLGETQPVAHNAQPNGADNPEGRAQNRRVEIQFSAR